MKGIPPFQSAILAITAADIIRGNDHILMSLKTLPILAVLIVSLLLPSTQSKSEHILRTAAMSTSVLDIRVDEYLLTESEWRINYTAVSKAVAPIFLVQHQRLPFLRLTPDGTTIEAWMGVPQRSTAELNRDINALILPDTLELPPGKTIRQTAVVKRPFKQSGYWLDDSEAVVIPLQNRLEINGLVIQGYGLHPLDPRRVHSIEQLLDWQLTARSQVFTMKLPSPRIRENGASPR